jgi:hypothetical protein
MRSEAWHSLHSELTSVGIMETGFGIPISPFSGQPVNSRVAGDKPVYQDRSMQNPIGIGFMANHL